MFTGIIEETGTVASVAVRGNHAGITVKASTVLGNNPETEGRKGSVPGIPTAIGDSISVNGVCLTVTALTPGTFTADVMPETMRMSSIGELRAGSAVNLERAVPVYGRFGGHIVSGHIDGTGKIRSIRREENAVVFQISAPDDLLRFIVEKGSIAVDGVSLTVASVSRTHGSGSFTVSIIPHTLSQTALYSKREGSTVNLETDIIGKYVEQLLRDTGRAPADAEKDKRFKELLAEF